MVPLVGMEKKYVYNRKSEWIDAAMRMVDDISYELYKENIRQHTDTQTREFGG